MRLWLPALLLSATCNAGRLRRVPHQALALSTGGKGLLTSELDIVISSARANASFEAWRINASKLAFEAEATLENGMNVTSSVAQREDSTPKEEPQCEIIRQYQASPSLCNNGTNDRIPEQKLQAYLQQFRKVWTDFKTNFWFGGTCCMGINHQFAIFAAVKELNPLVIIESGVAAGRGTWLLRYSAGPGVPIFSMDPGDPIVKYGAPPYGRGWKDLSGATRYHVGPAFTDIAMTRWDVLIPDPAVRARTLVILDDHQSSIERLKMLRNWGFRYVFYEDNYPIGVATSADKYTCKKLGSALPRTFTKPLFGDAYSPNTVCSPVPAQPVPPTHVLEKDRFGQKCNFLSMAQHTKNVEWFQTHTEQYFEFPAVFSRCSGIARKPLMEPDSKLLQEYGFPDPAHELWQYGHLFPALMDLKPMSSTPVQKKTSAGMQLVTEQSEGVQAALQNVASMYQEVASGNWL